MKTKIYLRIANPTGRGKTTVKASMKPDYSPIEGVKNWKQKHGTFYPTVAFAIEIDIPDESFKRAEKVIAQFNLEESKVKINKIEATI